MAAGIPDVLAAIAALDAKVDALAEQIENLEFEDYNLCTLCQGSGEVIPSHDTSQPTPDPVTCPRCNGVGKIKVDSSVEKD